MTRRGTERAAAPVELAVEALGAGGDGIARLGGERVFVAGALPGERVVARLVGKRDGALRAEPIERLSDGPDRRAPPCAHFGDCGGCAVQHLADSAYAAWKRARAAEALERRGLDAGALAPLVRTPPGGRGRARLVARREGRGVRLGFRARRTRRIVDLRACPVLADRIVAEFAPLRDLLGDLLAPREEARIAFDSAESGLDLTLGLARAPGLDARERLAAFAEARDLARLSWRGPDMDAPEPVVRRRAVRAVCAGVAVELPPGAFRQASAAAMAALCRAVAAGARDAARIADLYAGWGPFALTVLDAGARSVHAVEREPTMTRALALAAGRAGLGGRVSVEARDLDRRPLAGDELDRFDAVVLDPPRAGARAQTEALAESRLRRVVYVSCNPASFARDARRLVDGGFALARVTPVDQFLWSAELELVGVFVRE